jgi:DNA-binding GntR family transcriptional regulator
MTKPRRDQIAELLRAQIIGGAMPPGTRIREERIAEEQGVSRIPVREALQRLEAEGYLVLTPRRGATVATPSRERALDVMEVRSELEVLAARRAARAHGGAVAGDLARVVDRGFRAIERRRLGEIPALIDRFHELVAVAGGNHELIALLEQLRTRVRWMFEVDVEHRSEGSWADHRAILEAILAGDEDAAAERMATHVAKDAALYASMAPEAVDAAG